MSGQPNKNPSDADKFRQQYLANLNLRAKLDDVNLQANKVYKRTGQLPVEPSDFRTTEEKLADTERLKIETRQLLSEIADGKNANKIVQELTPKQLLFYTQNAEAINKELKPKYRLGIYAEIFEPFLTNYMNTTANVNGIQSGLQQTSGRNVEVNLLDLVKNYYDEEQIGEWGRRTSPNIRGARIPMEMGSRFQQGADKYGRIVSKLRRDAGVLRSEKVSGMDSDDKNTAYKLINDIAQELPTKIQIEKWGEKLNQLARTGDKGAVLNHFADGTNTLWNYQPETEGLMRELARLMIRGIRDTAEKEKPADTATTEATSGFSEGRMGKDMFFSEMNRYTKNEIKAEANSRGITIPSKVFKGNKQSVIDFVRRQMGGDSDVEGDGMKGTGVRTQTNWFGGIQPTKKYVPFGKYLINQHKLQNDIITIKRPSGGYINDYPSQKVSRNMGKIVRGILNQEQPEWDDLAELSDPEKAYLKKLATKTDIADRFTIPAPKKSDIDKETDEFEVMKGQIISGNDNKDLVRKFKTTMMKLSAKGVLPKAQVKEILLELTEMGL